MVGEALLDPLACLKASVATASSAEKGKKISNVYKAAGEHHTYHAELQSLSLAHWN